MSTARKKILFVINPHSGVGKHAYIERTIAKYLDPNAFDYDLRYTSYAGHAHEMAKEASLLELDAVVAVGGDGTINEVGSALLHSNTALGIIPAGSGNGLARHLGISMKPRKALAIINQFAVKKMDVWTANNRPFFNVSGLGFDAEVARAFAEHGKRGFQSYVQVTFGMYRKFKEQNFRIHANGLEMEHEAFMLSLANSSQFGNNAKIAPQASTRDGLLDLCLVPKFPLHEVPVAAVRLFRGTLFKYGKVRFMQVPECTIHQNSRWMHLDGDPVECGNEIKIKALPQGLLVIRKK